MGDIERHRTEARTVIEGVGGVPKEWSNRPHVTYAAHAHPYRKLLFCVAGDITFHLADREVLLRAGDRLDLPIGTLHRATVGPNGVVCIEGAVE